MMDEFGLRSRSNVSSKPDPSNTKFCLKQILSSDLRSAMGSQRNLWTARSSSEHSGHLLTVCTFCLLIPSSLLIQIFHNTSSDFRDYIFLFKTFKSFGSHLFCTLKSSQPAKAVCNGCQFVSATSNLNSGHPAAQSSGSKLV